MVHVPIELLPDETLPSYIARYHLVSGNFRVGTSIFQLCGSKYARINQLLPCIPQRFLLEQICETSTHVLQYHSALPLLKPFLTPEQFVRLENTLSGKKREWTLPLGSLTGTYIRMTHEYKYCPVCARDDMSEHGFPYWRLSHQLVGVSACPLHKVRLEPTSTNYSDEFLGLPPIDTAANTQISDRSFQLSQYITNLLHLTQQNGSYDLKALYKYHLYKHGYLTVCSHLRASDLANDLTLFWDDAEAFLRFKGSFKPASLQEITTVKRSYNYVKHCLVMSFLTETPEQFCCPTKIAAIQPALLNEDNTSKLATALNALRSGCSVRDAASQFGLSAGYVRKHGLLAGISLDTRASIVTNGLRRKAIMLGILGLHRKVIARRLKVSVATIASIIASTRDLTDWRKHLEHVKRLRANRSELITAISQLTETISITEFKQRNYRCYMWLYKNDREWLRGNTALWSDHK